MSDSPKPAAEHPLRQMLELVEAKFEAAEARAGDDESMTLSLKRLRHIVTRRSGPQRLDLVLALASDAFT